MSAGFTLCMVGGSMLVGNCLAAAAIADCTSCAAASILRSSRKVSVIWVEPSTLTEFMESRPGMSEKFASSGVATEEAMVSAFAPGREPLAPRWSGNRQWEVR